ncbi:MAG: hypothetical protein ACK5XN_36480, partial [Bacteroidota bacterium]
GKTLTISGAGTLTIAAGKTLTVVGTANFGGRPVTLKSTSIGTAAIGQVSGTLSNATNVTVERYVTARRRWRALTAPLMGSTNNSIFYNWQNNGTPSGNTGAIIWRPTGGTGFWSGGAATSILSFNSSGNSWTPLTSTNTALFDGSGNNAYMVFVTGPYNTSGNYVTSGSAVTTLSATGTLRSGNIIYTDAVAQDKFYMFGNPYASAINLKTVTKSGFGSSAYLWNPSLGSVGGWNTISMGGTGTLPVQSGQAFFLYANSASNTLTFKESDKLTGSALSYFRNEQQVVDGEMNIELNKYVDGKAELYDMTTVTYKGGNADRLPKLAQIYENLSVYQNGADFGVANRTLVNGEDNVQLRIWQMNEANYQLKINLSSMKLPAGTTAVLVDAFLNKETSLSLDRDNLVD